MKELKGVCTFVLLFLCCGITQAWGQTASVRGIVTAASDGLPLQGVNVVLRHDNGTFYGGVTDGDGVYAITRVTPGVYAMQVSFIGFQTISLEVIMAAEDTQILNFELEEGAAELDEVLIETERTTGATRVTAGLQSVKAEDLELVPAPDITADLANYLSTLPGVISTGDRGGQFFIRGGEPAHNVALLDGMYVYQPFHILGFYSAFSADVLNQADIHAGGYGADYSGRVSAIMDIKTRNGNKKEFERSVSIAPFVNAVRLEGPLIKNRISFLGSLRQSVIDKIASQYVGQELPYKFGDFFGKLHVDINANNQFSFTALRTYDRGALANQDQVSRDEVRWNNTVMGGRYLVLPKNSPVRGEILFSVSRLDSELGPRSAPTRVSKIDNFNAAINITNYAGLSEFKYGGYLRTAEVSSQLGGLYQNFSQSEDRLPKVGLYFEPDIYMGKGLRIRPGLTYMFFDSFNILEPRFRFVLDLGKGQLSGATGLYHQEVVGLNDRRDATNVFTAWVGPPLDDLTKAEHYILGYQYTVNESLEFSVEGYYKNLRNLYISEWTAFPRLTTSLQKASGKVQGLDLRVEFRADNFYSYVTYGISSVEYKARQESLELWFGSPEITFRPPHDRRHQVNALMNWKVSDFNINMRWNFGSGLPYNQVRGFDQFLLLDGNVDVSEEPGDLRVIYDRPYGGVLPTYHRLDFSVDRQFPFEGGFFAIQAGIVNVYDRANIFSLDLFTLERTNQLPFIPTLGLKIEF
ncbi:MAG: TonB-dependent receptor [Bacteroidota bacterium]